MFVTVHTCEGWVVRDEVTGRNVTAPTPSLRNAECERAEIELAWQTASPHSRSAMLLRFA